MSKRRSVANDGKKCRTNTVENTERESYIESVFIPDPDDSGDSDCAIESDSSENDLSTDDECDDVMCSDIASVQSYRRVSDNYTQNQKKLAEEHVFQWIDGEIEYGDDLTNDILLSELQKTRILSSSSTDLFEHFFSDTLKKYIVDATAEHGYHLELSHLDTFLGIIIFTMFNKRLSQRDYWSTSPLLRADIVASAMGRTEFEKIKSSIKYHKLKDKDANDKIWRVREITKIFNDNIKSFGFFCTALCVDEMMLKFYGKVSFKQFIQAKPIRFGIKEWALCSSNGYLFHFEIYCGKNQKDNFLPNCAQGSRVVMQMLHEFLKNTSPRNVLKYHVYFDNLFCCPDLLVHLKTLNLRATGTVRKNRIQESNNIDAKAARGTYKAKHDKNSGMNFITVVDSKPVSILSTAAGITPLSDVQRRSKATKGKASMSFPNAFKVYNSYMGGVDLHDQHCNKLMPIVRSKKWTWVVFMRLLQASIANATVLYNIASDDRKKVGTKEFALEICEHYLRTSEKKEYKNHTLETTKLKRNCSGGLCTVRTVKICKQCGAYFCMKCFGLLHA